MEIERQPGPGMMVLRLHGRMDAAWSGHVSKAIAECIQAGHHALGIDMAGVDYISSAGIRVLVQHARELKGIDGRFSLLNTGGEVRRVLALAGLDALLGAGGGLAVGGARLRRPPGGGEATAVSLAGARGEIHLLDAGSAMRVRELGEAERWLRGAGDPQACSLCEFGPDMIGLGLGALGAGEPRLGEFLAVPGAAVCQPADGSNRPDYVLRQGSLVPSVNVAYGIIGQGSFGRLLRFEKCPDSNGVSMSEVAGACLAAVGGHAAAVVMVAETAALVGAAVQRLPDDGTAMAAADGIFAFPRIREWLSFTSETAFAKCVSLAVGFVASARGAERMRFLKPMSRAVDLQGHFHAAAFPYRPIRRGKLDLDEALSPLFDNESVLGLLHLVNDWRVPSGVGESFFLRGACWCAPVEDRP